MFVTESSASVQSATEDGKLTRIRGGHKGAFTRLEQNVDEFTVTGIDSSTKMFQGEALLKTLQDRIAISHKNWNSKRSSMFLLALPLLGCLLWLRLIKKNVIDLRMSFQQTLLRQIPLHRVE